MSKQELMAEIVSLGPVVPVLVLDDAAHAEPLADALWAGGLKVFEITLRTPAALEVIARMKARQPEAVIGAGTVLTPEQLEEAERAGATFAVSPGTAPLIRGAAERSPLPFLFGASTASEAMHLLEHGYANQKFFPAEPAGGASFLKALASPLAEVRFCPTGGISQQSAPDYLSLSNVVCVGGSWMVPKAALSAGDWDQITELAAGAATLATS
ncbi:MAG: bifunctional 4-hydroxy-2-oxoglutarate aldolase/2-dehydro-3-deoxy-phosphogluconate aldolase [Geminicoccaceae bacterium]